MYKGTLVALLISISLGLKISAQSNTEKITDNHVLPADFPSYVNTGNPELDGINYEKAKTEWIKNNPEKYSALNDLPLTNGTLRKTEETIVTSPVNITKEEKDKWIQENPNAYTPNNVAVNINILTDKKANELHSINKSEFETMPLDKRQHILSHPELYKIEN